MSICVSWAQSSSIWISTLPLARTLTVALSGTIRALGHGFPLLAPGTILTPPTSGGFRTAIHISIMPRVLFLISAFIACKPKLVHDDYEASLPPCTCRCTQAVFLRFAYLSMHPSGFPQIWATSTIARKIRHILPHAIQKLQTLTPTLQGRAGPSHPPRQSCWRQENHRSPWFRLCNQPKTDLSVRHYLALAWQATSWPSCSRKISSWGSPMHPLASWHPGHNTKSDRSYRIRSSRELCLLPVPSPGDLYVSNLVLFHSCLQQNSSFSYWAFLSQVSFPFLYPCSCLFFFWNSVVRSTTTLSPTIRVVEHSTNEL